MKSSKYTFVAQGNTPDKASEGIIGVIEIPEWDEDKMEFVSEENPPTFSLRLFGPFPLSDLADLV